MSELPSGTVTFLFSDIEGSTRLLKVLGERYPEVLDEHAQLLRAAFAAHAGQVVDAQGDSFFAAFPRARDAVAAAVAAQRALAAHAWPDGVEVRVRMGLHTGEPLVGEERYVGLGVHRAARIEGAGHGGQVLLSQATRAVLADEKLPGIGVCDLGEHRLKDLDEPERIYQLVIDGLPDEFPPLTTLALDRPLLPAGAVPLPGPLVPTPTFPFVGREPELATLRAALARAEAGEGGLVLLAAEAGGGKTRLVRELAHHAAARGVLVCYGTSDAAVTTPYQPLREWLEFLLSVADPDALRECVGGQGAQLARVLPELERVGGGSALGGDSDRFALQGAITELLIRVSRLQPTLLVFDDLHWADGETLHLIRRLARKAPEARVLILAAYRDRGEESTGELADALADLARVDGTTRLPLGKFTAADVSAFIHAAEAAEAPAELSSAIGELTDGTPLLLCELWRDLRQGGGVEVADTIRLTRPLTELRGGERLSEVVNQRLSRLAPATTAMLELAAAAGARFEVRILGEAGGLDRGALVAVVEEAIASGIVEELPDATPSCRFSHELVRRAVYDRITRIRRPELHLRVGEALEHTHAEDPGRVLPELAHHFTLAAPLAGAERAVDYNLRAAEAAVAAAAYSEAVARLSTALEVGIADPHERARVQVELGLLLRETGRFPESKAALGAGLEAAATLGQSGLAAFAMLRTAGVAAWDAEDFGVAREAERVAEDAIETCTKLGDQRGLAEALRLLGVAMRRQGRLADAAAAFGRAAVAADACGDQRMRRQSVGWVAQALDQGPEPAREAIRRLEEQLRSSPGDRTLETFVGYPLSALLAMAGRLDESRELLDRTGSAFAELDLMITLTQHRGSAAYAKELAGDQAGAEQEREAQSAFDYQDHAVDARKMLSRHELALLYCDDGRWDDADRCLAYGREVSVSPTFTHEAALGLAGRARVAAHRGRLAEAVGLARHGVELAELSDMLNLRARVWLALAEVERSRGEHTTATAAVATALDLYEQKGNVAAADRLRALAPAAT